MRRSRGKIVALMALIPLSVWGETYRWHLVKSPESLRVGQSGLARYECIFDGSAQDYSIKLNLKENPQYGINILSERDRIVDGKRIDSFDIVITPKKSGPIEVSLDGTVEYIPPGAIDYSAHLGRDNVSKEDVVKTKTILPSFRLEGLSDNAELTGKITLEAHADHSSVRSHEPLHLSVLVKGEGNLDQFVPFELNISGVKVFAEAPQKSIAISAEGYKGEIRQEFALVSEHSYVIAPMSLRVFDTAENRIKELKTAPIHVEVEEGYETSTLLDAPDLSDTAALKRYALYAVLVLAGAVASEAVRMVWRYRPRRKAKYFWEHAETSKELVQLLSLSGEKRYDEIIREVENGSMGLSEAKKKLCTLTSEKGERGR